MPTSTADSDGSSPQIPVIDISQYNVQTADVLVSAVARYGFVFVKGQALGFTSGILDDIFNRVGQRLEICRKYSI